MQVIASTECGTNACPTVYRIGDDVVVQGYTEEMRTPDGESAVRLPKALILEAATHLHE